MRIPGVTGPALTSPIYETEPIATGPDAAAFLNAVVEVEFDRAPTALLEGLRAVEVALGRPPTRPANASRTIDLDLLYVGDVVVQEDGTVIPHPRMHLRRFVLVPLCDIRPDLVLPGQRESVTELLRALSDHSRVEVFSTGWAQ